MNLSRRFIPILLLLSGIYLQSLADDPAPAPQPVLSPDSNPVAETPQPKVELSPLEIMQKRVATDSLEIVRLKREVASLRNDSIGALKKEIDSMQRGYVTIASNFLYIPYDRYNIEELAIPVYEKAKGNPVYDQYIVRLELLRNLRADLMELSEFIDGIVPIRNPIGIEYTLNEKSKALEGLAGVKRNRGYGKDWTELNYGKTYSAVKAALKATDAKRAEEALKRIQAAIRQQLDS